MPAVQTNGDANSAGGVGSGGVASVRVNGKPVLVDGCAVSAHAPYAPRQAHIPHSAATTKGGSSSVKAGGKPIITTGCSDTCGHPRAGGSSNVKVG